MLTVQEYKRLKNASLLQMQRFWEEVYKQGFVDGLREAEKEFDDPELYQIIDADDAKKKLGDEAYRRLTDGSD